MSGIDKENVQTYPPRKTRDDRESESQFQRDFWRSVHHGAVINDAVRPIVHTLTREQRDNLELWTEIKRTSAVTFADANANSPDLCDLPFNNIVKTFHKEFDHAVIWERFRDYHTDYETKNTASDPNEKTDTSHIDRELYQKYFAGLDPLTICCVVSSDAEGCVRRKLTHRVDAILAFCLIAEQFYSTEQAEIIKELNEGQFSPIAGWIEKIQFYVDETHYMANNPGADMRFDDD